jgi:hypothetical protein
VDYRAIVASNDEAVGLTNAQNELLLKLETEPNGENALKSLKSVSNEYATLARDPSGPNVFRWRHLAPEATLRRPMPGRVIICLGGKCVVVSGQRATSIITEAFPVYKGPEKVGDKVPSAVCAAMALALYEHRQTNQEVRQADAVSDSNGGWLGTPATCGVYLRVIRCYYKLQDGIEEMQEIRVEDLERLLRNRQTAATDEGLVSQVVDSKTATVKAVDLSGQCADEAQNYRAIVPSKNTWTKSTATALTDLQTQFLCQLRANADKDEIIGEHASLSRLNEINALPGDRDSFLWRPTGPEATLCKPVQGHIIVCLDGECTVMNSQEALECIAEAGTIRPVCAAMAVALYTKRVKSNGTEGFQATAFSDDSGSWLLSPATCTIKRQKGYECTCFLTDGTQEVTEISRAQLSAYKPPASEVTEGGASHADTVYRAIVPSKGKPDARKLSKVQAELLRELEEKKTRNSLKRICLVVSDR